MVCFVSFRADDEIFLVASACTHMYVASPVSRTACSVLRTSTHMHVGKVTLAKQNLR